MSCKSWQLEISAWLDDQLTPSEVEAVKQHLLQCAACREFHAEQLDVEKLFVQAAALEKAPPPEIWFRLRREITAERPSPSLVDAVWMWLAGPRRAVTTAAALLLLFVVLTLVHDDRGRMLVARQLAELESYRLEVSDNPFARLPSSENPFWTRNAAVRSNTNPFKK